MGELQGYGLCKCGCGQPTPISRFYKYKDGLLIRKPGDPTDFLKGHYQSIGKRGMLPPGTLIDPQDQHIADKHVWCLSHGYVCTKTSRSKGKRKTLLLHRLIMDAPDDMEVDHINRNPLDNRKNNLRVVSRLINAQNISVKSNSGTGIRNVQKDHWGKYVVSMYIEGKRHYVGYFKSLEEASRAATEYRLKHMPGAIS